MAYSQDRRLQVIAAIATGMSRRAAAVRFAVQAGLISPRLGLLVNIG
jgi:hypothetical protein